MPRQRLVNNRRAAGLCRCGARPRPGYKMCERCQEKTRLAFSRRRKAFQEAVEKGEIQPTSDAKPKHPPMVSIALELEGEEAERYAELQEQRLLID